MQSFKEYLLKEQTTSPTSVPWLELELESKEAFAEASGIHHNPRYLNAFDNEVEKFVDGLQAHLEAPNKIDWLWSDDDNLLVSMKLSNRHYMKAELEEVAMEAARYCNKELSSSFHSVEDVSPVVCFYGPVDPNVIIEYPVIEFDLRQYRDQISLSNFDKHFPHTQVFKFASGAKGKVTNVLSLLKIKTLHSVLNRFEPWGDIVNKYIKKHDILGCQEELIDAGFKDLADL